MGWGNNGRYININNEIDLDDYRDEIKYYLEENLLEDIKISKIEELVNELFYDIHSINLGHKNLDLEYLKDLHDKLGRIING